MAGVKDFLAKWVVPKGFLDIYAEINSKNLDKDIYSEINPINFGNGKTYTSEESVLLMENKKIKDKHVGERCFIVGSGSSISKQDLTKLAGEIVLTVSNSFVHPAIPIIRPKYHILPTVLEENSEFNTVEEFMMWFSEMEEKTFNAEMFFHIGERSELLKRGLYKNRIIHWIDYAPWNEQMPVAEFDLVNIPGVWSVSETAIIVALYLGFSEIYLLGFDHDWFNGPYVYFFDEKSEHKLKPDISKGAFLDSEFQMRRHAYIFNKYKKLYALKQNIYNANADLNSYVDVFPKVVYEKLFTR